MERREIISTLRAMEVGQIELFPLVQKTSVLNTISERLYMERELGCKWAVKTNRDASLLEVRRVS